MMNTKLLHRARSIAFLILFLILANSCSVQEKNVSDGRRDFTFTYSVTLDDLPGDGGSLDVWLPVPHSGPNQTISNLKIVSGLDYKIGSDPVYGNSIAYFHADKAPNSSETISIEATVTRLEQTVNQDSEAKGGSLSDIERTRYLSADQMVPLDGPVREEAAEVVPEHASTWEKARAIYDHVTSTVNYDKSGEGWGQGDVLYACDVRKGNCTDFHSLFIGLARASGIPARFNIGFPLPADLEDGEIKGYHCWAEFYVENVGWVPVDASEAVKHPEKREYFFGNVDEDRVQFTRGRDLTLSPNKGQPAQNFLIYPVVYLDGVAYDNLSKSFSFSTIEKTQELAGSL